MKEKPTASRIIFSIFNIALLSALSIVCLIPVWHVLMSSLTDPIEFARHSGVMLWPEKFSLMAYSLVLKESRIWTGYANTLFNVVVQAALGVLVTAFAAYALSRKNMALKNPIMLFLSFTMLFNGGLIPTYLLITSLGMYNTRAALIIPGMISVFNLIIMRTFFETIPASLEESAKLDGASSTTILFQIMIPLAKANIAVIALFIAVSQWNSFFPAMIYLKSQSKYPLQLVLRDVLVQQNEFETIKQYGTQGGAQSLLKEILKYAVICVSTAPIMCLYPFIQKYFIKGVMIGSIKG